MQRRWLRLLVSAIIVIAALSAGAANALVAPTAHSCAEMARGSDCPDAHKDHGAMPRHCDSFVCGALQLVPLFVATEGARTPSERLARPCDDVMRLGRVGPPDLRPPIS
jgi:hypothetical protein